MDKIEFMRLEHDKKKLEAKWLIQDSIMLLIIAVLEIAATFSIVIISSIFFNDLITTTISIVLGFAAGFSLIYTLIKSFEKFEKSNEMKREIKKIPIGITTRGSIIYIDQEKFDRW